MFIKDQIERNTANTANISIRLDDILNQKRWQYQQTKSKKIGRVL